MTHLPASEFRAVQTVHVVGTAQFRVINGVHHGEPIDETLTCASTPQDAPRCYIYATTPIAPKTAYTLLKAEAAPDHLPSGQGAGMCFGRGTYITLANGEHATTGSKRSNGPAPALFRPLGPSRRW